MPDPKSEHGLYEPDDVCLHDFLFRPESDTAECLICGVETTYDEALLFAGQVSNG